MSGNWGKFVGGGLGWALGGPIGAILGAVLGSLYDTAKDSEPTMGEGPEFRASSGTQADFFMSLLVLSAAVMKADGRQLKAELDYIKKFLVGNFGEEKTKEALPTLKKLLETDISVRQVCLQIRNYVDHSGRLQLLHYLFGIAAADGKVDSTEETVLQNIATYFNISSSDYASIKAMFVQSSGWAYEVLETNELATDDEVKKAYRKMATKFHPDKVASLGQEAVDAAQKKFQKVQEAYEVIKKQRGIK
ncbi:MAG: TerB family tellurite resistance protein [Bacteroidota bacterium]|nr:TerB family tellurite resistance protein [Bacteroidota bacterium]MDX5430764.1 TerB family tellurite resistance protein [Bacteroidota bacterium]MDX5469509.1 TerB family tellurite resistance protein [Bacteroidota bacterium]